MALPQENRQLAIVLCGPNGSGKSTLWYEFLADHFKIPLLNADRLLLSLLPEQHESRVWSAWARRFRDQNALWMGISQHGIACLMDEAIARQATFAFETVFSYWEPMPDGTVRSKIELIGRLRNAGYFVVLLFVGLADVGLSIGRVLTRVHEGGHKVAHRKLVERFPRTQAAVAQALDVVDVAILFDNSGALRQAYTPVHVRANKEILFDIREAGSPAEAITRWLDLVAPLS
ncbi:toxin [Duganella sp. BJB1802]|uniref:toxin n=1 Tax=Duganella sp. BJB1802 TaxID=2744575 RepID=UPI0015930372|nr:toxin [Duganella sp. BJB1802]NVD70707.1 toxin [Duganella sp. BJB1802]